MTMTSAQLEPTTTPSKNGPPTKGMVWKHGTGGTFPVMRLARQDENVLRVFDTPLSKTRRFQFASRLGAALGLAQNLRLLIHGGYGE